MSIQSIGMAGGEASLLHETVSAEEGSVDRAVVRSPLRREFSGSRTMGIPISESNIMRSVDLTRLIQ